MTATLVYKVTPANASAFNSALPSLTQFWRGVPGVTGYRNLKPSHDAIYFKKTTQSIVSNDYVSIVEFESYQMLLKALEDPKVVGQLRALRQIANVDPVIHILQENVKW
jgi:hypothetical protein